MHITQKATDSWYPSHLQVVAPVDLVLLHQLAIAVVVVVRGDGRGAPPGARFGAGLAAAILHDEVGVLVRAPPKQVILAPTVLAGLLLQGAALNLHRAQGLGFEAQGSGMP